MSCWALDVLLFSLLQQQNSMSLGIFMLLGDCNHVSTMHTKETYMCRVGQSLTPEHVNLPGWYGFPHQRLVRDQEIWRRKPNL